MDVAEEQALDYVRGRDVACPTCAYNLRDLTAPRCPECGVSVRLRVVLAEPRLGLWLTALVPVMASAGVGAMFAVFLVMNGTQNFRGRDRGFIECFMAMILVSALMLPCRRVFGRLPFGVQLAVGLGSAVLNAALLIAGAAYIR